MRGDIMSTPSWLRPPDHAAPQVSANARGPAIGHTIPPPAFDGGGDAGDESAPAGSPSPNPRLAPAPMHRHLPTLAHTPLPVASLPQRRLPAQAAGAARRFTSASAINYIYLSVDGAAARPRRGEPSRPQAPSSLRSSPLLSPPRPGDVRVRPARRRSHRQYVELVEIHRSTTHATNTKCFTINASLASSRSTATASLRCPH